MEDVERLFKLTVNLLADQAPSRLRGPIQIADLYLKIIPYKTCKAVLRFDTNQDYEMAMLRMLAGEYDYATVEPHEAQDAMLQEVESINPNPGAFRDYAAARVTFSPAAVRRVLEEREGAGYAPPDDDAPMAPAFSPVESTVESHEPQAPRARRETPTPARCPHCFETLPTHRSVVFCPFCGKNVKSIECPQCGSALEPGWRFCITCGQDVMHE